MATQDRREPEKLTPEQIKMLALVVLAASSYPSMQNKDPFPITKAWSLMLSDIPFEILHAAVVKVCRSSEFFPSVAQIVETSRELDPRNAKLPTAAEAWEEVNKLIRDVGPYRAPVYSCDTVQRAARAIGWRQLCEGDNPEADRAHFMRIYDSMRNKFRENAENEKALQLSGMDAIVKALAGKIGVPALGEPQAKEGMI